MTPLLRLSGTSSFGPATKSERSPARCWGVTLRPEWRADYFAANIGDPDEYNIEIAYKPWLYK